MIAEGNQQAPRRLIILQGEAAWCRTACDELLKDFPANLLYRTAAMPAGSNSCGIINQVLGSEYAAVVVDTFAGLDPDLLAAVGGTVVAGGALVLLSPKLDNWPDYPDPFLERIAIWPYRGVDLSSRFIARLVDQIRQSTCAEIYSQETGLPDLLGSLLQQKSLKTRSVKRLHTQDQQLAIEAIVDMGLSLMPSPIVLQADRGRGKSAAMGFAINKLLSIGNYQIIMTAPGRKTLDVVVKHCVSEHQKALIFMPPDALCASLPKADLVIVDEAAAIPLSILLTLVRHYSRIVLATTVHGYEGTGRGFALRFQQQLNVEKPGWKKIELSTPIRYRANDPLEQILFDALLLDAEPNDVRNISKRELACCTIEAVTQDELVRDESKLRAVLGLLVLAHYQTRPADLRHLLDGRDITLYVATFQGKLLATSITVKEGGFDQQLAHEIHYGKRRPRGHLVAQSLAVHAGHPLAPTLRTERIMRIVVHPFLQRYGVGSRLVRHIVEHGQEADYVSSSFGVNTVELPRFWLRQGFVPVRMGLNRDARSGSHSVIVCKAKTELGKAMIQGLCEQFSRYFPLHRKTLLTDLSHDLSDLLMPQVLTPQIEIDAKGAEIDFELEDICSYVHGNRGYEFCQYALEKRVSRFTAIPTLRDSLTLQDLQMVERKIVQRVSWEQLVDEFQFQGKNQAKSHFRTIIRQIVERMQVECL